MDQNDIKALEDIKEAIDNERKAVDEAITQLEEKISNSPEVKEFEQVVGEIGDLEKTAEEEEEQANLTQAKANIASQ